MLSDLFLRPFRYKEHFLPPLFVLSLHKIRRKKNRQYALRPFPSPGHSGARNIFYRLFLSYHSTRFAARRTDSMLPGVFIQPFRCKEHFLPPFFVLSLHKIRRKKDRKYALRPFPSPGHSGAEKMCAEKALYRKSLKHFLATLFVRPSSCFKEANPLTTLDFICPISPIAPTRKTGGSGCGL